MGARAIRFRRWMERVSIWRMSRMMDRVMGGVRSAMRRLRIAAYVRWAGLDLPKCLVARLVFGE
jgi:hypothetical protein